MDILVSAIVLVLAIAVAGTLCYILKNIIVLFVLNLFHVMSLAGAPDLPIDGITVLVSAIGGLPGVILRVILHLSGVVV